MPLPAAIPQRNWSDPTLLYVRGFARSILITLLTVVFLFSINIKAQQSDETEAEVISVKTELLLFPVRLRDRRGQRTEIKESELSLKDKDQVITGLYFARGADRLALVFALDQSGSLRDTIAQQREAAVSLFGRFSERSRIAVLHFSETPTLVVPFGRDKEETRKAFDFSAAPNRSTAIFDAAAAAVRSFDALPRVRSERRIAILISDGLDNASTAKASAVIELALQKGVSFYVIHIPLFEPRDNRLVVRSPAKGFRELAERTGGKYFLVGDAKSALLPQTNHDLTPVFQAIEDDLRSQYLLGFYAGELSRDGRMHRFALSMPEGLEYQVNGFRYSRSHEFSVPHAALKIP
ncbi:MAG: VWA domain-containing protein [bacterium]